MSKRCCIVCTDPLPTSFFLCPACARSYDRAMDRDATTAGAIRQAMTRARRRKGRS